LPKRVVGQPNERRGQLLQARRLHLVREPVDQPTDHLVGTPVHLFGEPLPERLPELALLLGLHEATFACAARAPPAEARAPGFHS
jgi:hypothetical protein